MRELLPEIWPHKIIVNSDWKQDITAIELWLGEQLGTFKGQWKVVYHYNHTAFYFRLGKDATMFALRWS